jgi:hypothetical protein
VALVCLVIWFFKIMPGLTAVLALAWAATTGQLARFQAGATSIFDDEEPVGQPTDAFPSHPSTPRARTFEVPQTDGTHD